MLSKAFPEACAGGSFATGSGLLVSGTGSALVMAMTGRATYCDDLVGDGAALLRRRCGT
ncbi:hypothetical protein ABZ892_08845 [Streptomyces sp. NPDC046924]|uniref:hypothetical protein n=1 Tax=Streptomyces sp. NPDC046924 TaxID=3155136 RepID=UPI0033F63FCC